jgi:O-antigen/teichoic acid export membrane protein
LATLAQFNLGNVYARILPTAGHTSRRLVFAGYAAVGIFSVALGIVFLALGLGDGILSTPADRWWFPAFVCVLAIFALQDYVLIAVHAAKFVPLKNALFSIVKIVLLVALASRLPDQGISVAWIVPAAVGVVMVTALLPPRAQPDLHSGRTPPAPLPTRRVLGGMVVGEYLSNIVGMVIPTMLPLLVVWRLGAEANAYFSMPWLIYSALIFLIWNIASSLLVEASSEPSKAAALVRRALRLALLVGGAGAVFLLAAAPQILSILGPGYAAEGTAVLRVFALAVPFNVIVITWNTLMRIDGRMVLLVGQQVLCCAVGFTLSVLLLPVLGITGAGVGYLIAYAGSGIAVAWSLLRRIKTPGRHANVPRQARTEINKTELN